MPSTSRTRRRPAAATQSQLPLFLVPSDFLHFSIPDDIAFSHITTHASLAQDGAVVTARCVCGGRREVLLEHNHAPCAGASGDARVEEQIARWLGDRPARAIAEWRAAHLACATTPMTQALPSELSHLMEAAWQTAEEVIAAGHSVESILYLLMSPTHVRALPLEQFGAIAADLGGDVESSVGEGLVHTVVRRMVRDAGVTPLGVVAVREAWMAECASPAERPSTNASRDEALVVVGASPDYAVMRLGRITLPGAESVGLAAVEDVLRGPLGSICPAIDGALATVAESFRA